MVKYNVIYEEKWAHAATGCEMSPSFHKKWVLMGGRGDGKS